VTRKTIALKRQWPDITFSVSIHGTDPYYRQMTGAAKGVYQRIKQNVNRDDFDVLAALCVTRLNYV
jgi:hypothetical protein